jgi:protein-S-isoprenylcysteine O-methyltransferase Ste14
MSQPQANAPKSIVGMITGSDNADNWIKWELVCNLILASYFGYFAAIHGSAYFSTFRISTLLLLMKVSADVFFHLVRKPAKQITRDYWAWFIGIAGAYTILFFQPVAGSDSVTGTLIQLFGMTLQVAGMLSLNRSIGFVAANRGVKTGGMYKFVRHPLYFAYTISFLGYLINQFNVWNLVVYIAMVVCLYLRTRCEEDVLRQDPEYQTYAEKVKYRMIPGLL